MGLETGGSVYDKGGTSPGCGFGGVATGVEIGVVIGGESIGGGIIQFGVCAITAFCDGESVA